MTAKNRMGKWMAAAMAAVLVAMTAMAAIPPAAAGNTYNTYIETVEDETIGDPATLNEPWYIPEFYSGAPQGTNVTDDGGDTVIEQKFNGSDRPDFIMKLTDDGTNITGATVVEIKADLFINEVASIQTTKKEVYIGGWNGTDFIFNAGLNFNGSYTWFYRNGSEPLKTAVPFYNQTAYNITYTINYTANEYNINVYDYTNSTEILDAWTSFNTNTSVLDQVVLSGSYPTAGNTTTVYWDDVTVETKEQTLNGTADSTRTQYPTPEISAVSPADGSTITDRDGNITLSCDVSFDGTANITMQLQNSTGAYNTLQSWDSQDMTAHESNTTTFTTYIDGTPGTSYTWRIYANDTTNPDNYNSTTTTFTYSNTAPAIKVNVEDSQEVAQDWLIFNATVSDVEHNQTDIWLYRSDDDEAANGTIIKTWKDHNMTDNATAGEYQDTVTYNITNLTEGLNYFYMEASDGIDTTTNFTDIDGLFTIIYDPEPTDDTTDDNDTTTTPPPSDDEDMSLIDYAIHYWWVLAIVAAIAVILWRRR